MNENNNENDINEVKTPGRKRIRAKARVGLAIVGVAVVGGIARKILG